MAIWEGGKVGGRDQTLLCLAFQYQHEQSGLSPKENFRKVKTQKVKY